jgi:hypothetical protein
MLTTHGQSIRCECGYKIKPYPVPGFVAACLQCMWCFDGKDLTLRKGKEVEYHLSFNRKAEKRGQKLSPKVENTKIKR